MARRRRRGTLGGRPGEFFPFGTGGALGAEGQQITYDLPLVSVATLDDVLAVLDGVVGASAIQMAWGAGDGNAPRRWLGAVNTTDRLTLTGSPTVGATPWQDPDGTAIASEVHSGASYRRAATGWISPAAGEDVVALALVRDSHVAAGGTFLSAYDGTTGWILGCFDATNYYLHTQTSGGYRSQGAALRSRGSLSLVALIWDRTADTACAWTPGGSSSPLSCTDGDVTDVQMALGCYAAGTSILAAGGGLIAAVVMQGAGVAATLRAGSDAVLKTIGRLLTGIEPRSGSGLGATTFTRTSAASMTDRNGRLHLISSGMPRAGEALAAGASGIRLAPSRTNKVYNNVNPAATTGWTATGGTHAVVSDAAALATDKCEALGPNVFSFEPGAGDEVVYGGAATATTNPHSLSVYLRGAAGGESVDIGLRDASSGAVQNCGTVALTTHWVRYLIHGAVPADTDQVYALDCDAGDTIYHAGDQLELGARCTSMIPNWATAAAAARAAEVLTTPVTLSDAQGAISCGVTPMGWSDTEAGDCLIVDRATGTAEILRADSAGGLCSDDGTTEARDTGTALADGVRVEAGAAWGPVLSVIVNGVRTSVAYDGALQGSGALTLEPDVAEVAIDSLRVYRRYR